MASAIFSVGNVDYGDAKADADLRSGETDAVCGVHGFEHVGDESLKILVEFFNGLGGLLQNRIAVLHNRMNHLSNIPLRERCLFILERVELFLVAVEVAAGLGNRVAAKFFHEGGGNFERDHGFTGDAAGGNDANIGTFVGGLDGFFGVQIGGHHGAPQGGDGLQVAADDDVAAVGNAAFEAAGAIGSAIEAVARGVVNNFVLNFGAVAGGIRDAGAEFDGFHGLNGHDGASDFGVELFVPLDVRAEARRDAVRDDFKDAADGIAGAKDVIDFGFHARFGFGIDATERRIEILADGFDFLPSGGAFEFHVADGDGVAEDVDAKFAEE